ncbi:MOB kinase activator-like 2 isoform X2 [Phymastichus coffea]|nr:MOB kinase activator-like 2 isoform X2 [Phymastichus coffea]XP_058804491.1 MOB kinase activator-like 2 isoform X2 [Phymastichus coffea]
MLRVMMLGSASAPSTPLRQPTSSSSSQPQQQQQQHRSNSIRDTCHRKIRFFSELVAKARRKEKDAGTTEDPKLYLEEAALERQLPDVDMRVLVDLPPGLDYNEWLASHTLALFDHINLVYGTVSEFCTPTGCPDMTGPGTRTYLWFDEKGKKTRVAAPQYVDYVMTFTQRTVSDETIFPTKYANEFPSSFESLVRKILRLLYHVVAHIYHCHFREVALLGLHVHLNCVFAHLTLLNQRFNLIDQKETEILGDLEAALLGDSTSGGAQTSSGLGTSSEGPSSSMTLTTTAATMTTTLSTATVATNTLMASGSST